MEMKQENIYQGSPDLEHVCLTDKDCILPNEYTPKGKFKRRVLMDCLMKLRVEKNDEPGNREFQERAISALLRRLRNNFTFFTSDHGPWKYVFYLCNTLSPKMLFFSQKLDFFGNKNW